MESTTFNMTNFVRSTVEAMQIIASTLYSWNWIDTTGGSFSVRDASDPSSYWITPRHTGFRRWNIQRDGLQHLDRELNAIQDSTAQLEAHPSAMIHQLIYAEFQYAGAIIHTHSPYSLTFACMRKCLTPLTLQSQILGEVPCFESDVDTIKDRHINYGGRPDIQKHSGTKGRDYVYDHFDGLRAPILQLAIARRHELRDHGLAFTIYKHGIFVIARNLNEAFDNLIRIERNAQVQILKQNLP